MLCYVMCVCVYSDTVKLMVCRYTRLLSQCSKTAAEWQATFNQYVTNTYPGLYQYVVHPRNRSSITQINHCDKFTPGWHHQLLSSSFYHVIELLSVIYNS